MQAISSSLEKESERIPTLDGEGEGGKPRGVLDAKKRENERNAASQILAGQGNEEAEKMLNLVHTITSMLRAKDAITSMPSTAGDDFEYPTGGSDDTFGDDGEDDEVDFMDIGGETQTALQATTDANTKSLLQADLESLHLHKIQSLKQNQDVSKIKTEIGQKLVAAQTSNSAQLDANKKGDKDVLFSSSKEETTTIILVSKGESASEGEKVYNIQVSKVIVPAITFSNPPVLDNIDLIKIATTKLELKEKWKKLDENIGKNFGPIKKQDKAVKHFSHFSQLRPISVNEMTLGNMERGQPSVIKSPQSIKLPSLVRRSCLVDPRDSVLEKRVAKIYRNGKLICVVAGPPQFAEAKNEEKVRLKQQQRQAALDA
ncbi:hypothetical protein AgCh_013326 [Apium graveolens]